MINKINTAYNLNIANTENIKVSKVEKTESKELSKVEKIKEEISNGTYKLDLNALSEKIAEELL